MYLKLPKKICDDINKTLAQFWWGRSDGSKGMHWFAWQRMSLPKKEGGMGFRNFEKFNDTLLGKQVWRILTKPTSLMARVLKGKYFPNTNVLNARSKKKGSFIWNSLLHGQGLLKKGLRFFIGNGKSVGLWSDSWLPTTPPRPPIAIYPDNMMTTVLELLTQNQLGWNEDLIRQTIIAPDAEEILSMKLCPYADKDPLVWH